MGWKQHHFVLVHGSGHGSWCWVKIVAVLEKAGHRVTAVNLASAGEDKVAADDISSLEQYDRPLEDLFASFADEEKVILVGHSLGGVSLTHMSELFSKKISVTVYIAAFIPAPGKDINELKVSDPEFMPGGFEVTLLSKVEGAPPTAMIFPFGTLRDFFTDAFPRIFLSLPTESRDPRWQQPSWGQLLAQRRTMVACQRYTSFHYTTGPLDHVVLVK